MLVYLVFGKVKIESLHNAPAALIKSRYATNNLFLFCYWNLNGIIIFFKDEWFNCVKTWNENYKHRYDLKSNTKMDEF